MHRIDGAGHINNLFVAEDALTNRPPTEITDAWMNDVQENICRAILSFGVALEKGNYEQLANVLALLAKINSPAFTGNPTAPTPARFDAGSSLSTTEFVKRAGKSFSGTLLLNANTALMSESVGSLVLAAGEGLILDLPLASTVRDGDAITFLGFGWALSNTIRRSGADNIYPTGATGGITSFSLGYGDTITVVANGVDSWYVADGNATQKYSQSFKASFGTNTTQRLPSGLLKQTGIILTDANGNATLTLPEAFGTALVSALGVSNATQGTYICNVASASKTQVAFKTTSLGTNVSSYVYWEATGY